MRAILLLIALLISYGSLYPFAFETGAVSPSRMQKLLRVSELSSNTGNLVANLLLFMPYGFFAVLALRHHARRTPTLAAYIVAGMLLATALQVAQLWLPGRVPTLGDALINLVGIVLGAALASPLLHRPENKTVRLDGLALSATALAGCWIIYRWFPVVPTLDVQNIKNALKPLLLEPILRPTRTLHDMLAWLAFFRLLGFTPLRRLPLPALALGALFVLLLTPLKVGGTIHPHNMLGLMLAIAAMPLLRRHDASTWIAGGLFVIVMLTGLAPYQLAPTGTFHWIPFSGFLGGSMQTNLLNLFYKCFIYGAMVFLLRDCGFRPVAAAMSVAGWLALVELFQLWLPGRTAEITDPVLALLIAFALHRLADGQARPAGHDRRDIPPSPRITRKSFKDNIS